MPGPWASVGVQATVPLALKVKPAGPLTKVQVSAWAGTSVSVVLRPKFSGASSSAIRFEGVTMIGAELPNGRDSKRR